MLIYHPAYDMNHGMYRMLRLLEVNPEHKIKWDTFRILDLYYLFPHLLGDAQLPRGLTRQKRAYGKQGSKYNRVPSPRIFIQQMIGIHEVVARSLIGKGIINADAYEKQLLERTDQPLPASLLNAFQEGSDDQPLVELLAVQLAALPLSGPGGLKERTGLLEHRYDAV
jgi:hypothetical protein